MRQYTDWQFFNRKPEGTYTLMQACYSGKLWNMGLGFGPARIWCGRFRKTEHKYLFHLHIYLPLARTFSGDILTYTGRLSFGWYRKGKWHNFPKRA